MPCAPNDFRWQRSYNYTRQTNSTQNLLRCPVDASQWKDTFWCKTHMGISTELYLSEQKMFLPGQRWIWNLPCSQREIKNEEASSPKTRYRPFCNRWSCCMVGFHTLDRMWEVVWNVDKNTVVGRGTQGLCIFLQVKFKLFSSTFNTYF